jgi:hypothetical protein
MKRLRLSEDTTFRGNNLLMGEVCDLPDGVAHRLIASGKAESVSSDTPLGIPETEEKPKRTRKAK